MKEQMNRVDALLNHIGEDPEGMSENEKIDMVLHLVYVNLVNMRMGTFMEMISDKGDSVRDFLMQLTGQVPSFLKDEDEEKKMDKLRDKFFNYVTKFKDNPTQFFKDECEKFNYVSTKMLKKISKLYALAKDDDEVNESIINWELHQQLLEKKYGKRKIETEFKFKK
jgi:hypothetical protein